MKTYEKALELQDLEHLSQRRDKLCKSFAIKNAKSSSSNFKVNDNLIQMKLRNTDKYIVTHCNTERLKSSAIPQMQIMLNQTNH